MPASVFLKLLAPRSFDAVVNHDRKIRGEAAGFPLPITDDRRRADEKQGPTLSETPVPLDEGKGLDGLSESHIVSQTCPKTPLFEKTQPRVTAHLIGP